MTAAHSPGPWMFVRNAVTHSFRIESETLLIARMVGIGDESDANAKLISAAPDLAEALAALLYACDSPELIGKARAALEKAGL